jgi:hypothetical protein
MIKDGANIVISDIPAMMRPSQPYNKLAAQIQINYVYHSALPFVKTNAIFDGIRRMYFAWGVSPTLYYYDIMTGATVSVCAFPIGGGVSVYDGGDYIYFINYSAQFYRYSLSANTWTSLTVFCTGTSISVTYDGSGCFYVIDDTVFKKYTIATGAVETLASLPSTWDYYRDICYDGFRYCYLCFTSYMISSCVYRYDTWSDIFERLADPPGAAATTITSFVFTNDGYIQCTKGSDLLKYAIDDNEWYTITGAGGIGGILVSNRMTAWVSTTAHLAGGYWTYWQYFKRFTIE